MAAFAPSPPIFSDARLTPSASRSPNPSRLLIICSRRLAPATSPHFRSKPTCCLVSQPFSRPSITHPMTQPNSLTSTHARSVCVLSHATPLWSVAPIARPALVLRLVDDLALVRALTDDRHVAVMHAAGVALVPTVVEAFAQLRRLPRCHVDVARDVRRVVADRQHPELREVHHPGQRAVLVERARGRIGLEIVRDVV